MENKLEECVYIVYCYILNVECSLVLLGGLLDKDWEGSNGLEISWIQGLVVSCDYAWQWLNTDSWHG